MGTLGRLGTDSFGGRLAEEKITAEAAEGRRRKARGRCIAGMAVWRANWHEAEHSSKSVQNPDSSLRCSADSAATSEASS